MSRTKVTGKDTSSAQGGGATQKRRAKAGDSTPHNIPLKTKLAISKSTKTPAASQGFKRHANKGKNKFLNSRGEPLPTLRITHIKRLSKTIGVPSIRTRGAELLRSAARKFVVALRRNAEIFANSTSHGRPNATRMKLTWNHVEAALKFMNIGFLGVRVAPKPGSAKKSKEPRQAAAAPEEAAVAPDLE